jgi:hypothetical protein
MLFDYTGDLGEFGPNMETGARLAEKQINASGGVLGQPIELVKADGGTNEQKAVQEATRLVDVEGVQAIIGCLSSGVTIAVAQGVTVPSQIVQISPASTAASITDLRTQLPLPHSLSTPAGVKSWRTGPGSRVARHRHHVRQQRLQDRAPTAEGPRDLGGTVTAGSPRAGADHLRRAPEGGGGDPGAAAISYRLGHRYLRKPSRTTHRQVPLRRRNRSADIVPASAPMSSYGPGRPSTPEEASLTADFDEEYEAEYGEAVPALPYVRESYDAVIAISLAAEAAGSTDPSEIRDALREVAGPPGDEISASAAGVEQALEAVRAGTDIDFQGSANRSNWDVNGDVLTGAVEIFRIVGGAFEVVKVIPVDLSQ